MFGSRIALAITGHSAHEIAVVDMDGGRTSVVTKMGSDNLLPGFSPTGAEIAFTSYLRNNPDLYSCRPARARAAGVGAGRPEHGCRLVAGRALPGAHHVVRRELGDLQIDPGDGRVEARLTNNPAIDSSPAFSPDGSQIAFVSNRTGLAADLRHVGVGRRPPSASPSRGSTTRRRA